MASGKVGSCSASGKLEKLSRLFRASLFHLELLFHHNGLGTLDMALHINQFQIRPVFRMAIFHHNGLQGHKFHHKSGIVDSKRPALLGKKRDRTALDAVNREPIELESLRQYVIPLKVIAEKIEHVKV